ncbi:MAG: glycosyltransferase [Armatimonadetes bacterium]|nr:glycosyltransferase [Armatimonadota bacterium]
MSQSSPVYLSMLHLPLLDGGSQPRRDYVLELARALAGSRQVERLDLLTWWSCENLGAEPLREPIGPRGQIVHLPCNVRQPWLRPGEFIARARRHLAAQERIPDVFHGHVANAGVAAAQLGACFGRPSIFTAHGLGRLAPTREAPVLCQIALEEEVLGQVDLVIAGSSDEVEIGYPLYSNGSRPRCALIPPGLQARRHYPYYDPDPHARAAAAAMSAARQLERFLCRPKKPLVVVSPCRQHNLAAVLDLIGRYREDRSLRAIANLAVLVQPRQELLTPVLLEMDRHDLYGSMAVLKGWEPLDELPALYRLAASGGGLMICPHATALPEECLACGLPVVALERERDAVLGTDHPEAVAATPETVCSSVRALLVDRALWSHHSRKAILRSRQVGSWEKHCRRYLESVRELIPRRERLGTMPTGLSSLVG